MKRYIKNFMMAMMVGATVFGSSCTDSFEEVNTDPDSPTDCLLYTSDAADEL